MGLFSIFPGAKKPMSSGAPISHSDRLSPRELEREVRYDLHDKLGRTKGEQVFNTLNAHLDSERGSAFGTRGVTGREVTDMIDALKSNPQDNLHERDINHVEDVLRKHFND